MSAKRPIGRVAVAVLAATTAFVALAAGCGIPIVGVGIDDDAGPDTSTPPPRLDGSTLADVVSQDVDASVDAQNDADASIDAGPCPDGGPVVPPLAISLVTTTTFGDAVFAAQAPGSDDWYVVEQSGIVRLVRNGTALAAPFLDLTSVVGSSPGERGLLSIAFHPSYPTNGRFFVMITPADNSDGTLGLTNDDVVVELRRSTANADVADPAKVQEIVHLPQSASNHNGGTIMFGPDGMLYVGTGDGGGACESAEPGAVQDTTKLFGKILRLDVDKAAPFAAAGNPFANDARVYHYGLRNPYRWGFDSLTGDLWIGDVGQSAYEEISFVAWNAPGKNFGWPAFEGATAGTCGVDKVLGGPSPHTPPLLSIDRTGTTATPFSNFTSVIGGRVYRGSAIPSLFGAYVFSDFTGGEVGFLRYCDSALHGPVSVPKTQIPAPSGLGTVASIVEGHDHELYVVFNYGASQLGKLVAQ